ncbi:DUF5615 family PIN-like protein [Nostoc sp.]|uniref:DUF5615 family PIN-like protein n=1 Tax=Nostoc sp. TaxID=1180 RepID=UPI002FF51D96
MNLSPDWVAVFKRYNITAVHWSTVGDRREKDSIIMEWARTNGYIVFTHDLDFGSLLAATGVDTPSVIQGSYPGCFAEQYRKSNHFSPESV